MNFNIDDLSVESVRYNANSTLRKLFVGIASACVTAYHDNVDQGNQSIYQSLSDVLSESSHMVREHTGIDVTLKAKLPPKTSLDTQSGYTVEVEIPKMALTPSSMYPKLSDKEVDRLFQGDVVRVVSGTMDLEKSKVSGVFSKIGFTINYGVDIFRPEFLTHEEIAAIMLHEMGHIWDFLTNLGEVARGVVVSAHARKILSGNYSYEKKLSVVNTLGLKTEDPTTLGDEELTTLVAMHAFARNKTMQASVIYNKNAEEYIADSFAAMHGLAYETASAMRKLEMEKSFYLQDKHYRPVWMGALDVVNEFTNSFSTAYALGSGSGILLPIVMPMFISVTMKAIPYFGNKIPVTPVDRINKLRESLIAALRDPSVTDSEKKHILADIQALNGEAKKITFNPKVGMGPWDALKEVLLHITPTTKARRGYYTRTNLDSLTDNRLFEITEKLKQGL